MKLSNDNEEGLEKSSIFLKKFIILVLALFLVAGCVQQPLTPEKPATAEEPAAEQEKTCT